MTITRQYVVVGAGGTASHLIHSLVQYATAFPGEAVVHVWDADEVKPRNLERQLFYPTEVGAHKASAFKRRWPNMVSDHVEYVGKDNIERAVKEGDVVLICADNMAVRRVVNARAKELDDIVVINGGNEEHTGSVQHYVRSNDKNRTPPIDFQSPEFDPKNDEIDRTEMSCAQIAELPGGEQTIIANQTVAAMMMAALWRNDNGIPMNANDNNWTKLTFDHINGEVQTSDLRMLKDWDKDD